MSLIQERLIWIVAAFLMLGLGILYERHQGAVRCVQGDAKAALPQELKDASAAARAQDAVEVEKETYAKAIAVPLDYGFHVRLCNPAEPSSVGALVPAAPAPLSSVPKSGPGG